MKCGSARGNFIIQRAPCVRRAKKDASTHPRLPAWARHFWCHNAARNELGGGEGGIMLEVTPGHGESVYRAHYGK